MAAAAATVGALALVAITDTAPPAAHYAVGEAPDGSAPVTTDPLRAELVRCRTLPANRDDARCQAAWDVNRRRFMGESRSFVTPVEPAAIEPAPLPAPPNVAVPPLQSREH
jgi:conjugative transfer region protein TrbK